MAHYRTDTKNLRPESKVTHEVFMLSDKLTPSGGLTDAFGRFRVSNPLTLFDSQHLDRLNSKFNYSVTGTSNTQYSSTESSVKYNVGTSSGDKVYAETSRVFAYQPGKSLLVINTFCFDAGKANLRQRGGYFNSSDGVFLEKEGTTVYIVQRSSTSGIVQETRVAQSNWNVDKFDGTGLSSADSPSGNFTSGVDFNNTVIFWTDIEWLGVGDVRTGFVIDGKFYTAHVFYNNNQLTKPYMNRACLPVRFEIENTGATSSNSMFRQICSTVISEGGYSLGGKPRSIGLNVNSPRDLTANGIFYPVVSIRLKPTNLGAIVDPTTISAIGVSAGNYRYQIRAGATINGAIWTNVNENSTVQYNSNNSATLTGGTVLESGYFSTTAQATGFVNRQPALFRYQLERNSFTNTANTFTLAIEGQKNGDDVLGSIDWQEYT